MALVETTMSLDEISIASIEICLYYLSSAHLTGGPNPRLMPMHRTSSRKHGATPREHLRDGWAGGEAPRSPRLASRKCMVISCLHGNLPVPACGPAPYLRERLTHDSRTSSFKENQ